MPPPPGWGDVCLLLGSSWGYSVDHPKKENMHEHHIPASSGNGIYFPHAGVHPQPTLGVRVSRWKANDKILVGGGVPTPTTPYQCQSCIVYPNWMPICIVFR